MKKVVIVYHRVDFDGIFSCCTIIRKLGDMEYDLVGYDYSDKSLPNYTTWPEMYDTLYMADVSFPSDAMLFLKNRMNRFIYEDHHEVSINKSKEFGYDDLEGRREIGISAAEITWLDLFPEEEVPLIIQYVSAHDVWDKKRFNWINETYPVHLYLETTYDLSLSKTLKDFPELITYRKKKIRPFFRKGKFIKNYFDSKNRGFVRKYSFEVSVGGKYTAIAILNTDFTSSIFDSLGDKYKLFIVANRISSEKFKISLYGTECEELKDFSCGEFCKSLGGGGHRNAASCIVGRETFDSLIYDCKI